MEIAVRDLGRVVAVSVSGRLDGFAASEFQEKVGTSLDREKLCAVFDMGGLDYLSSAGLRVLLMVWKELAKRGGTLAVASVTPYCQSVMETAGFASSIRQFTGLQEALAFTRAAVQDKESLDRWDTLEVIRCDCGTFRTIPGGGQAGIVDVLGDVKKVLYSDVSEDDLCSKRFSETEYSIGLGALGDAIDDYFPIMGEMITAAGAMVWLPSDGHDTPDFLIPKKDTGRVMIRTSFNVALSGGFNDVFLFDSAEAEGTRIDTLYRTLFGLARTRRTDFHGVLGLALCADMATVYGSGIKKSPIRANAPENGETVVHPANYAAWFDADRVPRHRDVSAAICGVGADLTHDLSYYSQEDFGRVFYVHPDNVGRSTEQLHNHVVVFRAVPLPERAVNLDVEITRLVDEGEFVDMRHLLDVSGVRRGLIGVCYVQEFRDDPHGARVGA